MKINPSIFYDGLLSRTLLLSAFLSDQVSSVIVYTIIFSLSMNESQKIEQAIQQMNRYLVSFRNVDQLMAYERRPGERKINAINTVQVRINSFSYNGRENVLHELAFDVHKGECVLINGKMAPANLCWSESLRI